MQIFRLMGLPDKVIAFDELPKDLLKGFELCRAEGFPKYWKKWMGEMEIVTKIPSELNPVTGQRSTYEPFVEKDSFFYLVDWTIKPVVEKWKEIEAYVRSKVPADFRLTDKLEDMAKPLAPDKVSGITLEPDDVTVIPIPKEIQTNGISKKNEPTVMYKCEEPGCDREFDHKNGLRLHGYKKHPKKEEAAATI